MLPYQIKNEFDTALESLGAHISSAVAEMDIRPLKIDQTTFLEFEDGTTMDGITLLRCVKLLQRLIDETYPEELL